MAFKAPSSQVPGTWTFTANIGAIQRGIVVIELLPSFLLQRLCLGELLLALRFLERLLAFLTRYPRLFAPVRRARTAPGKSTKRKKKKAFLLGYDTFDLLKPSSLEPRGTPTQNHFWCSRLEAQEGLGNFF